MMHQNRKSGFTSIIIILLVIVGIGAIAGLGYYIKNKASLRENLEEGIQSLEESQDQPRQRENFQMEGLLTGTIEDLVVGEKVIVRGTANDDGSITANIIYVGVAEEDFQGGPGFSPDSIPPEGNMPQGITPPEGIDFEELKDLSAEERMEIIQELRGENNFPVNGVARREGGSPVQGEIIDKDEISITVKLTDGGSRLVFYSENTQIMKRD